MVPGEIFLVDFPFGGRIGSKIRPALLLTGPVGSVPEVAVAYISSVIPPAMLPSDLLIDPTRPEFISTNLRTRSVLRLHKLVTLHSTSIVRRLGYLPATAQADIATKLRTLLKI